MHDMTVRAGVLRWSTLVFLAFTGMSGLARAQQVQQPEGGATVEISVPSMDAGTTVLWVRRPSSYETVSLFASLDFTNISVATGHSSNVADPSRSSILFDLIGESGFFPQVWISDLPTLPPSDSPDVPPDESVSGATVAGFVLGLPPDFGLFLPLAPGQGVAKADGYFPLTNPDSGSGRWYGQVIGTDIGQGETHGNQILGDATIVLEDFTDPHVDVQFSGLLDVVTGSTHADVQRTDIPVDQGFSDLRTPTVSCAAAFSVRQARRWAAHSL